MKNFVAERKNKLFFFMKHSFFCLLIVLLSFLTIIFISKLYGRIIFGLSVVASLFYFFSLNSLYKKNTEYLEAKQVFEDDKNEFVKLFQKTFIRFLLPILIVGFSLNLAIFHNLLVHTLLLLLAYLFFFIYINIKLIDILVAKKKRWKF
jgi:hypothetical protein